MKTRMITKRHSRISKKESKVS